MDFIIKRDFFYFTRSSQLLFVAFLYICVVVNFIIIIIRKVYQSSIKNYNLSDIKMGIPMQNLENRDCSDLVTDTSDSNMEDSTTKRRHTTSKLEAALHLFKGSVGAGLFAMGDCFKNGGLIGTTIMLPMIAALCVHCEQMLIDGSIIAAEHTKGVDFFDYPDTVERSFAMGPKPFRYLSRIMKFIVQMFLCVTQFGFCAVYFVFISESLVQVLHQNGINWNFYIVLTICLLPVLIPSLMTNLKYLAPISVIANLALIVGIVATLVYALKDGLPSPAERHYVTNTSKLALSFGTALFSYEGIALVLPLRNSMRQPEKFNSRLGVLNVTIVLITMLFIFTGFFSYLRWGEDVQGSITLNLDGNYVAAEFVKIIAALGVFLGYPLQFYIMIKIIWPGIKESLDFAQNYPITAQVILRFIMVMLTFGVALVVPKLDLFISLIGSLCSTSLAFAFPVMIDVVTQMHVSDSLSYWRCVKNLIIFLVAIVGISTGTYQSIVEIINAFDI